MGHYDLQPADATLPKAALTAPSKQTLMGWGGVHTQDTGSCEADPEEHGAIASFIKMTHYCHHGLEGRFQHPCFSITRDVCAVPYFPDAERHAKEVRCFLVKSVLESMFLLRSTPKRAQSCPSGWAAVMHSSSPASMRWHAHYCLASLSFSVKPSACSASWRFPS